MLIAFIRYFSASGTFPSFMNSAATLWHMSVASPRLSTMPFLCISSIRSIAESESATNWSIMPMSSSHSALAMKVAARSSTSSRLPVLMRSSPMDAAFA